MLRALVETIKGKTIYNEFLEEHGEGIHHIGFPTPLPFEAELKKWKDQGIKALQVSWTILRRVGLIWILKMM
jgi:4-hydroxyphenylpyruvate dioxygenase-like putative hemolysin